MHAAIESIIKDWPKNPRESAKRLVDYYGEPDEHTPSQLVWFRTHDGWKRTVLSRTEVPHDFPAHHTDFLEQWIDYQVPVDMYSKLAEYDGSVIVERTKGELSARCGGTSMNFVAVNLAHDIVTGAARWPMPGRNMRVSIRHIRTARSPRMRKDSSFRCPTTTRAILMCL